MYKQVLNFFVKKRRYFLMAVIVGCFSVLVLSVSGLLQFTAYVKREKQPALKQIVNENAKQKLALGQNPKEVSQEIYGLYLPNYDENGKEVSVIRGAYTVFLKNEIYKITNAEIEFSGSDDKEKKGPKNIIITSDFGEISKVTSEGFLYGNVIIRLEGNFKIFTEDLRYFPDDKRVRTEGPVTIKSEGIRITGSGFEVSLPDTKASVKDNPEMKVNSSRNDINFFPDKDVVTSNDKSPAVDTNENVAEDIFIRSSGDLVFENKKKLITFNDNVRVSRGKSTIFSDKLTISFDSDMKNVSEVIASGNVLASDSEKTAKGETLTWNAGKAVAILEDDPVAEFFEEKISIAASKIQFFKDNGKVEVPVGGQLNTKIKSSKSRGEKRNGQGGDKEAKLLFVSSPKNTAYEDVTITWGGSMSFHQDKKPGCF